jgi:hypothetical protein
MTAATLTLPERAAPPAPLPAIADDIAARLAAAEQELAALEAQLPEASLAKELDEPGAADALSELDVSIRAAARKVERLRMSHHAALERDAVATRKALHEFRLRNVADFEAFAAQRIDAAKALAAGIAQASLAFRQYVEVSQGLSLILPFGVQFRNDELMMVSETPPEVLAAKEMYRLGIVLDGQGIPVTRYALPGAQAYDINKMGMPEALPSLIETVEANTAAILSIVRERVDALA